MCIFGILKYVSCENNTLGVLAMSIRPENCFVASLEQVLALADIIWAVLYVSCNRRNRFETVKNTIFDRFFVVLHAF